MDQSLLEGRQFHMEERALALWKLFFAIKWTRKLQTKKTSSTVIKKSVKKLWYFKVVTSYFNNWYTRDKISS